MGNNNEFKDNNDENENKTEGKSGAGSLKAFSREDYGWFNRARSIVYYVLGVVEVLLFFRLFFKLLGANQANIFVDFLYSLTRNFILPFYGIFKNISTEGAAAAFVLEPSTIIAMAVYAIIAWGIVRLLRIKISY